jgi:chromosome segregation ATPase
MHFSTPDEKITKEMIMGYQKKEQEKHYDDGTNKFQYVPTGLTDSLVIFSPTAYKTFKDGATEEILKKEQDTLNTIYEDLRTLQQEVKKRKQEIFAKIDETNSKQREIDETKEELKAEQLNLKDLQTKEKNAKNATRRAELKAEIKIVENKIKKEIPAKLATLRGEHLALDTDRKRLVTDYNNFLTTVVKPKETDVGNQIIEIEQVKDNIKINKETQQDVNNKNKEITKKYTKTFNMANRDRYSIQQDPYESDADYCNPYIFWRISNMAAAARFI